MRRRSSSKLLPAEASREVRLPLLEHPLTNSPGHVHLGHVLQLRTKLKVPVVNGLFSKGLSGCIRFTSGAVLSCCSQEASICGRRAFQPSRSGSIWDKAGNSSEMGILGWDFYRSPIGQGVTETVVNAMVTQAGWEMSFFP